MCIQKKKLFQLQPPQLCLCPPLSCEPYQRVFAFMRSLHPNFVNASFEIKIKSVPTTDNNCKYSTLRLRILNATPYCGSVVVWTPLSLTSIHDSQGHVQCQMKNVSVPQSWPVTLEMNYFAQFSYLGYNFVWLHNLVRGNILKLNYVIA